MEATRYVEVPADALMGRLQGIGAKVVERGGTYTEGVMGREVYVDLQPAGSKVTVRVYTSLSRGADAVRGCGEDAVRLVIGHWGKGREGPRFWDLAPGRRIFRTAPTQLVLEERVKVFLDRFEDALRDAYRVAKDWHRCHACGCPMVERQNKARGTSFMGCTAYPDCRATAPVSQSS